jgi:hypothetical protein
MPQHAHTQRKQSARPQPQTAFASCVPHVWHFVVVSAGSVVGVFASAHATQSQSVDDVAAKHEMQK